MGLFPRLILAAALLFSTQGVMAQTSTYQASNPQSEFLMSCTYGVLAGTLIGAASLAFVDRPSENLDHVARGASIGLYAGILLGLYVIYVVPSMEPDPYDNPLISSNFQLNPLSDLNGNIDGAEMRFHLFQF